MKYGLIMLSLVLAPVAFAQTALAEATCHPNYQVTQSACRDSGEIAGFAGDVEHHVRVNAGACKVPDALGLCREFIDTYSRNHPNYRNIEVSNPSTEGIAEMCGGWKDLRQKVNVFCDFSFEKPVSKKVTDPNCPVENVQETNSCFAQNAAPLDQSAIADCLSLKVVTKADLWIKGVCLHDINQAALNINISQNDFAVVQSKLAILKSKIQGNPEYDNLSRLLESK